MEDSEEDGDPLSPLVFQVTHRRPPSGIWSTRVPIPTNSLYYEAVEEHHASKVNVGKLEQYLQDIRHRDLRLTDGDVIVVQVFRELLLGHGLLSVLDISLCDEVVVGLI